MADTLRIVRLQDIPAGMDAVINEAAERLGRLYGAPAAEEYRVKAPSAMRANIANPGVYALGAYRGHRLAGLLLSLLREPVGEIPFMHVLKKYEGAGVEDALVDAAVKLYRAGGVDGILCECLPLSTMQLDAPFSRHGFEKIEREIMVSPLDSPALAQAPALSCPPLRRDQWEQAAQCLVDAYEGDPGRLLHLEVGSVPHALDFLERLTRGSFGEIREDFSRMTGEASPQGVILGCRVAPGVGFVLQVAVRPAARGKGLATELLRAQAGAYRQAGFGKISLGVTRSNPAKRLYEQLGFETRMKVDAFVWWRPGCAPLKLTRHD